MDVIGIQKPPAGLRTKGKTLWRATLAAYDMRADELLVLESACRMTDELSAMQAALRGQPVMIEGSQGQMRPHPLFAEVRNHRLALAKLLGQLSISDADAEQTGKAKSHAGRQMARLRWG
jgi:hypothetical protein